MPTVAAFCLLLILPLLGLARFGHTVHARWVAGACLALSLWTFLVYRHDKQRARTGGRRTRESTLHLFELLGGWPGAFLGQHCLHHKRSKRRYQLTYWLIVLIHQCIALDSLFIFPASRSIWQFIRP